MSDLSLKGLLEQLTAVLSTMTAGEELCLREMQRLRAGGVELSAPAGQAFESKFSPMQPQRPRSESPVRTQDLATAQVMVPSADRLGWATGSEANSTRPGGAKRDYDYFAELDEKLTDLRQRYLE